MPRRSELVELVSANPQLKNATLPLHVLVGPNCPRNRTKLVCPHVFSATPPSGSFVSLAPGIRCVSPLLLPVLMAPHLTHNELVLLLAELLGVYAVNPSAGKGLVQRARPLISPDQLRAFLDELGPARGTAMVRAALDETPVGAASPMEAKLHIRSTRGFSKGGYHFGEVALNDPVEIPYPSAASPLTTTATGTLIQSRSNVTPGEETSCCQAGSSPTSSGRRTMTISTTWTRSWSRRAVTLG